MSELIKREDAIKITWQEPQYYDPINALTEVREKIRALPTVDAAQVVRCGRCEYYFNEMNCCSYVNGLQNVTKTDYCSYGRCADGERRTE